MESTFGLTYIYIRTYYNLNDHVLIFSEERLSCFRIMTCLSQTEAITLTESSLTFFADSVLMK